MFKSFLSRSKAVVYSMAGLLCISLIATAQQGPAPNSDPTYQQLRNLSLSGEVVGVSNLTLKRDAGTFHVRSGSVCFVAPEQRKVTGAVFVGDGSLVLDVPLEGARSSLKLLTKESEFAEAFDRLVLRFTDGTFDEIKKHSGVGSGGCEVGPLQESQKAMWKRLNYNLDGRILEDVLSPEPGSLFVAFVHGKHYDDKEIFAIDPHGVPALIMPLAPEEVELITYDESKFGAWSIFPPVRRIQERYGFRRAEELAGSHRTSVA